MDFRQRVMASLFDNFDPRTDVFPSYLGLPVQDMFDHANRRWCYWRNLRLKLPLENLPEWWRPFDVAMRCPAGSKGAFGFMDLSLRRPSLRAEYRAYWKCRPGSGLIRVDLERWQHDLPF